MPVGHDALNDPRFANLDAAGMVDLCASLADYGEAGGLSRDLMLQVGSFAEARFRAELEVQLAVSRMYLLGGETARAHTALIHAGRQWPDEERVRALLEHVLKLLDDPRSVDEALRSAPTAKGSTGITTPKMRRAEAMPPRGAVSLPGLPAVKPPVAKPARRSNEPATPPIAARLRMEAEARAADEARAHAARRMSSRPPDPLPQTPVSGMPMVPRAPALPRGMGPVSRGAAEPMPAERRVGRATAAARALIDAPGANAAQIRTEISRRAIAREVPLAPPDPPPSPHEARVVGGVPRTTRLRLLDADDDSRRLDPYELIAEIASGGMATVFLARLAGAGGFQRLVAIKRLHPILAREEQFVEMFLDEARLAAGIHHPHVVPILEVGMSDAGYYLVMEFIEGDTLSGVTLRSLQRGAIMPAKVALRIVLDSLSGLHAAHQLTDGDGHYLGLVHRDCTPQNVLVGVDGSARITDFGVARAASRLAITRPQQVKGKVAYLSPEQAHAQEIDRRSDIFTMGIVLWEALAGRPLFQCETEAATLARLLSGQVPSIRSFVPDVPAALDDVCRRALQHDRNRRFRTAAEMAEAIERAASSEDFGGAASPRELGRFIEGLMGAEIAAQREQVRTWISRTDSGPMSRGPRSRAATASVRPPAPVSGARASSPPTAPPASPVSADDLPPETPAPRAERFPSRPPSPLEVPTPAQAAPAPTVVAKDEERSSAKVEDTPTEPTAEAAAPPPEDEPTLPAEGAPAPVVATARADARASSSLRRRLAWLVSVRVSTRAGRVLAVALVLLATAPLAYKMVRQRLGAGRAPASSAMRPGKKRPPSPSASGAATAAPRAHPTTAWDEAEVPEAGAPDEAPAEER